jgi:putative NADH-flavin reductase
VGWLVCLVRKKAKERETQQNPAHNLKLQPSTDIAQKLHKQDAVIPGMNVMILLACS